MKVLKAWNSKRKEWFKSEELIIEDSGKVWAGDIQNPPIVLIKSEDIFFSTRMKDQNGNVIFDNSIIQWEIQSKTFVGTVKWSENTKDNKNEYVWIVETEDGYMELSQIVKHCKDSVVLLGHTKDKKQVVSI